LASFGQAVFQLLLRARCGGWEVKTLDLMGLQRIRRLNRLAIAPV
jgi:hypothetical protein